MDPARTNTIHGARLLLAALALGSIAACATPKPQGSKEYFETAEAYFREGAYTLAIDDYREMIDQYPFGSETEEAELRIAHAHFLNGSYIEAVAAFTDFQRRHPTSPFLPFVGYELGLAYKRQMGTIDRDQSAARNADAYFTAVVSGYPESPYAELARGEIDVCEQSMASHELYVARYYQRRGNYPAQETRSLEVISRFPETSAADEALFDLGQLYEAGDNTRRASLAYAALLQDHPLSTRAEAAQAALDRLQASTESVGPAARQALLASTGYESGNREGKVIAVPGIDHEASRPFAPPSGLGMPIPGTGGGPRSAPAPNSNRGGIGY